MKKLSAEFPNTHKRLIQWAARSLIQGRAHCISYCRRGFSFRFNARGDLIINTIQRYVAKRTLRLDLENAHAAFVNLDTGLYTKQAFVSLCGGHYTQITVEQTMLLPLLKFVERKRLHGFLSLV